MTQPSDQLDDAQRKSDGGHDGCDGGGGGEQFGVSAPLTLFAQPGVVEALGAQRPRRGKSMMPVMPVIKLEVAIQ